ncbi:MAG: ATP-binding protein [Sideroxydans sp.]|nr:ATP-binding protein [Sideroxydans sp.]
MRDNLSLTGAFPAVRTATSIPQDSHWRPLSLFNLYRLILGGLLLFVALAFGDILLPMPYQQQSFVWVSAGYILMVAISMVAVALHKPRPSLQLAFQVSVDIAAVALWSYFSQNSQSNLGMLLLLSLALAGVISRGRITLLYAALASIAMLLEHGYAVLTQDASVAQFFQAGILSASYFAVAWFAHTLTRYANASERLAMLRGVDLSNMAEANRLMIQDMPDGVLVVDERGNVRQFNPGAERLLGYVPPIGVEITLAQCSPLLEALFAAWRQNKALGYEVLRLPLTNQLVRVRFLPVEREGFWGAVVVLEDMQRAQEQAQQVKLAALGRLTANIAHEVRNPLSSISYAAELLKEEGADPQKNRLVQIILDNTSRLNRIVHDVMQINRRDRAQPEYFDLSEKIVKDIEALCQVESLPSTLFSLAIAPHCEVYFDRGHFEQILWNLCRNAVRYSQHKDGSVQLKVEHVDEGRVLLRVIDDGVGVQSDAIPKLFEPFNTTDAGGTGLGLYIARELCEANGALIEYVPDEKGGACFRILFGLLKRGGV